MFKTKVGYSTNPDARLSGVETAKMAVEQDSKIGLLFTSCVQDQESIIKGIKEQGGDIPIIGCTSSAAIIVNEAGYLGSETGYSGMMTFSGEDLIVGVAASKRDDEPREVGKKIAREAIKKAGVKKIPNYFFMVASPKEEEEYLKGIQDVIGRVPMFGGSCADNTVEGNWSIFTDEEIFNDGCAVAFFYATNECKTNYTGEYRETNNMGIITQVQGKRTLAKIDNVAALEKYATWIGSTVDNLKENALLTASITKPLGIKDPIGNLTVIRHPMFGDANNVMNLGNNLAEKTTVIQMEATVDELIKSNSKAIHDLNQMMKKEAASYLLIHCGGRRLGIALAGREHEIYEEIRKGLGDKPFLMVFTFGEYGYKEHSANTCGGLMLSFTGFSE